MVQEQVFVGKGCKNMSDGKGTGIGGMSMGMFGVHEGTRAQNFGVGTGSGRASLGQSGMLGTDQHKQPVQTSAAPAPAPAPAPAIAPAIASDMFVVEPALASATALHIVKSPASASAAAATAATTTTSSNVTHALPATPRPWERRGAKFLCPLSTPRLHAPKTEL